MIFSQRKGGSLLLVIIFFLISTPTLLKADFRYGVYFFNQLYGGIDFSEDKEVYSGDPSCDMDWGQVEIPNIHGFLIDLGVYNFFYLIEAPDEVYPECQINMELNHVYVLRTKENCYVKILIISVYTHAMLWVYQDDGSTNLDWRGTTTEVSQTVGNRLLNPMEPILIQNYPNPFNLETTVELVIPPYGLHHVKLNVLNSNGQSIAELLDDKIAGGIFRIKWNGRLNSGAATPSGVYFITAIIDNKYTRSKRILLMK